MSTKENPDYTENFINCVFIFVTILIMSTVFWTDTHDVYGYYQNLMIASFSIAIVILHIYRKIVDTKDNGFPIPNHIRYIYNSCLLLCIFCCGIPIVLVTTFKNNKFLSEHMLCNKNWGICFITFLPVLYISWWGYIYPLITDVPSKYKGIHLEQRPQ